MEGGQIRALASIRWVLMQIIIDGHDIYVTSAMIGVGLLIDLIVLSTIAYFWRRKKRDRW